MNIFKKFKKRVEYISKYISWHNPYYYWWKARNVFKRPKWKLYYKGKPTWFYGMSKINKFIDIQLSSLGWKPKYQECRHEYNPYFSIVLFNSFHIIWTLSYDNKIDPNDDVRNTATWEAMIDYLYFNVTVDKLIAEHTWKTSYNKDTELITIKKNLKRWN